MDTADEMNVGGELRQDAVAAVGAVAADEDVIVWKPRGNQGDQLDGELRTSAMIGVGLGFGGLGFALFTFGHALAIAIEPHGDRQSKDLGRRPPRMNDENA